MSSQYLETNLTKKDFILMLQHNLKTQDTTRHITFQVKEEWAGGFLLCNLPEGFVAVLVDKATIKIGKMTHSGNGIIFSPKRGMTIRKGSPFFVRTPNGIIKEKDLVSIWSQKVNITHKAWAN